MRSVEMAKCCKERAVWAPHSTSAGTSMVPKESLSVRVGDVIADSSGSAPCSTAGGCLESSPSACNALDREHGDGIANRAYLRAEIGALRIT